MESTWQGHTVTSLVRLLELEQDGPDSFAAPCPQQEAPRLFGGQVLAQALRAACLTAPAGRRPHSLHAYFLRPGRPGPPARFTVTRSREGRSFSARLVTASQGDEVILAMMASFHAREDGPDWQARPGPEVPGPGQVRAVASYLSRFSPLASFEVRPARAAGEPTALHPCWIRCTETLPADAGLHACAIALISDIGLVRAARQPGSAHRLLTGASLDHALWLHRPASVSDWLLLSAEAANNSGARGFATGTLHTQDGTLVASVAQEAILRPSGSFPPVPQPPDQP